MTHKFTVERTGSRDMRVFLDDFEIERVLHISVDIERGLPVVTLKIEVRPFDIGDLDKRGDSEKAR